MDGHHSRSASISVEPRVRGSSIHWGTLMNALRERDFTDWYVVLERHSDRTFRLTLTDEQPDRRV